jgi:hypothetical protein
MIRYSDYNGPQDDVTVRDGHVVPFDRDAAHEMAQHAQVLASDVSALDGGTEGGTALRNCLSKPIARGVNVPAKPFTPDAYERLIHDVMLGDRMLFTASAGIERLWEVSEPLLERSPAARSYPAGSWGPGAIDELIASRRWHLPNRHVG